MQTNQIRPVVRVRKATAVLTDQTPPQNAWRGYGSVPAETPDQFHERMYENPPLEACIYELDFALQSAT